MKCSHTILALVAAAGMTSAAPLIVERAGPALTDGKKTCYRLKLIWNGD